MRRRAVSLLLGGCYGAVAKSAGLDGLLAGGHGAAVLVDVRSRRVIAEGGKPSMVAMVAPPASTVKPFVLASLITRGKLRPDESFLCPGRLRLLGRILDCSHPRLDTPMSIETAIAYSCNCFVAHAAERFEPGELGHELGKAGFRAVGVHRMREAQQLQALGEAGILTNVAELAFAYRLLARDIGRPEMAPILAGLEGAVEFGTAQHARVAGVPLAGKTGSTATAVGEPVAWFAGMLPSRAPEAVVAVILRGRSGGADAAPAAARILEAYRAGRL